MFLVQTLELLIAGEELLHDFFIGFKHLAPFHCVVPIPGADAPQPRPRDPTRSSAVLTVSPVVATKRFHLSTVVQNGDDHKAGTTGSRSARSPGRGETVASPLWFKKETRLDAGFFTGAEVAWS